MRRMDFSELFPASTPEWQLRITVTRNDKGEYVARLVDMSGEAELAGYKSAHRLFSALGHVVTTRANGRNS